MSNLQKQHQLIQKIHQLLPQVCVKNNIEKIEVESDYFWVEYDNNAEYPHPTMHYLEMGSCEGCHMTKFPTNQLKPQIRQILVGLKEVLGENPRYIFDTSFWGLSSEEKHYYPSVDRQNEICFEKGYENGWSAKTPKSQAEALCQKWLDGLNPLFDREPETVLQELVEILENLLK